MCCYNAFAWKCRSASSGPVDQTVKHAFVLCVMWNASLKSMALVISSCSMGWTMDCPCMLYSYLQGRVRGELTRLSVLCVLFVWEGCLGVCLFEGVFFLCGSALRVHRRKLGWRFTAGFTSRNYYSEQKNHCLRSNTGLLQPMTRRAEINSLMLFSSKSNTGAVGIGRRRGRANMYDFADFEV